MAYRFSTVNSERRKDGIEALRETIHKSKQDIRDHFKTYHEALTQTEMALLSDLDGILARRESEKLDIARKIKEVEAANEFMRKQLESSINEVLTDSVSNLNEEIKGLRAAARAIPPLKLNWKFNYILSNIHELCVIEEGPSPYESIKLKRSMIMNGGDKFQLSECWDFCYDSWDKNYYFVNCQGNCNGKIVVLDSRFNFLSSENIEDVYSKCYIKSSPKYIFVNYAYSPPEIAQYLKSDIGNGKIARINVLYGSPSKMDFFGNYLFVSSSENEIYKLRINDLKIETIIKVTNESKVQQDFKGIVDLKVTKSELFLLFNSPIERSLQCFDLSGAFIREIINNFRGLQNPLGFCFDSKGNVLIADGKIKVFDKFGKQIDSFGKEVEDYSIWAMGVALDPNTGQPLVLADLKGKCLHAYTAIC